MSIFGAEDSTLGGCLEQFENEWLQNLEPPDFLHYCHQFPAGTVDAREAVCALAMIDLELGWRSPSSPLFRPCTGDLEQLDCWQLTRSQIHELVASESIVRSRWKDRPQIEDFIATRSTAIAAGERDRWRLIVANRDHTNVSREQLQINRLSLDLLEVTLLSKNVASKIDG